MPVACISRRVFPVAQILQLVALHLLFAALGFCHISRAAARAAEVAQDDATGAGKEAKEGTAAEDAPLLGEAQPPLHCWWNCLSSRRPISTHLTALRSLLRMGQG